MLLTAETIINTETTPKNTVEMLREARKQANLTQKQFADKYQIPIRTLQAWENEERTPPEYVLNMLMRCLAVDFKIKPRDLKYNGEKYTLTYLDGTRLNAKDEVFVRAETRKQRVRIVSHDGVHQCEVNGFLFKATRNYNYVC